MIDASIATLAYSPFAEVAQVEDVQTGPTAVVQGGSGILNVGTTIEYDKPNGFGVHYAKLKRIDSDRSLWPEGADRPVSDTITWARVVLQALESIGQKPTRVVASAEGGIAICFVRGDKYADIECLNSGSILGVISDRYSRPVVWEIGPSQRGIALASARIREFIVSSATAKDDPKRQARG